MSDLIKRQDAINAMVARYDELQRRGCYDLACGVGEGIEVIKILPPANPVVDKDYLTKLIQEAVYDGEACEKLIDMVKRPTGKWIISDESYWRPHHSGDIQINKVLRRCPECMYGLPKAVKVRNFCPNCGADMRGGDAI